MRAKGSQQIPKMNNDTEHDRAGWKPNGTRVTRFMMSVAAAMIDHHDHRIEASRMHKRYMLGWLTRMEKQGPEEQ